MTKYKSIIHYSKNVHGQPNANNKYAQFRENWSNSQTACSSNYEAMPTGEATSNYQIGGSNVPYKQPWTFTGHDFGLNVPDCAYIDNIVFTVRIKVEGRINVNAPYARFNLYNGSKSVSTNIRNDTGWDNGFYYYNPNVKLSNTWQDINYVMSGDEFRKRGYPISSLNELIMGIDLRFYESIQIWGKDHKVSIQYIKCTVNYEVADQKIIFDKTTSANNPRITRAGEIYEVKLTYRNDSPARCCTNLQYPSTNRQITVKLPQHAQVIEAHGNYSNGVWTVPCTAWANESLTLRLRNYGSGNDKINLYNADIGSFDYWIYSVPGKSDVGDVTASPKTMQRGIESCIEFNSTVNASDGTATFNINVDTVNNTNPSITWNIIPQKTSNDVSIDTDLTNDSRIVFNVPQREVVEIGFCACFVPNFTGESNVGVQLDNNTPKNYAYNCLAAPTFVVSNDLTSSIDDRTIADIQLLQDIIQINTHRVASSTELGAFVIDCGIADFDSTMIMSEPTLTADYWEPIDYIGCVPLEYHHYDPDSTYSNKAISEAYKNKVYKGKEGVIEEKISLKFKARPWQVPTLQGLTELDKPTPINANHKCFEGDPLNHRGWAVLSQIKAKRTNPLWYDVEAEVDYITHDIHTKFEIFKGLSVNNVALPDLLVESVSLMDNLSTKLDELYVDTDGGFIFDDEDEDGVANIFSLDEGQHLSIKTKKSLSNVTNIRFDWYSNEINEKRENRLERIFRLRDKDGNSVFEYEYTNFSFDDEYVTCDIIIRVLNEDGGWVPFTYEKVDLKTEIDADPITDEEEFIDVEVTEEEEEDETGDDTFEEEAYEEGYIAPTFNINDYDITKVYGTSLQLYLNKNKLTINDEGYNGREVHKTVELINSEYTFESEWKNKNHDGTTEDIISYIGISLNETILDSLYSKLYSDVMVSPFPIPYKKIVFTRESEEGTIYYLTGEAPFRYLLEPYYQYHCGTDLVSRDNISLMTLNNSYTSYYIQNGLVRFGFNKYNGRLSLAKYDPISKKYITTNHFHMSNDIKFSLAEYSDDKIIIKAGTDTLFTIWRGRPYIMVNNPTDTIYIDTTFHYCFSDKVEGVSYEYPLIHSFMNTDNLLPACIGGKSIDYDCIEIDDDQITPGTNHTITVNQPDNPIWGVATTLSADIDPATNDGEVHYLVDGVEIGSAESPFTLQYTFAKGRNYELQAVYTGDEDDNIAISEKIVVNVGNPTMREEATNVTPKSELVVGEYNLAIVHAPSKFTYRDGERVDLQLTKGGTPIQGLIVECQMPNGHTLSKYTNANGIVSITNNSKEYVPGTYQWGGRFYDGLDTDNNRKLICSAFRSIKIEQAIPTFTHNAQSTGNKVNKGKDFIIKLKGVETGLDGKKLTYTVNGGAKKTKTTNEKGNIHIKCNNIGNQTIKVSFAGSTRYKAISQKFTIKVV